MKNRLGSFFNSIRIWYKGSRHRKYIKISGYGLVGLVGSYFFVLFLLPTLISWFVTFPKESQKKIDKIEKEIVKKEDKADVLSDKLKISLKRSRKDKLELQKTNLSLLRSRLALVRLQGIFPKKNKNLKKKIKRILRPVPVEPFSGIRRIVFEKTGIGGWYYDLKAHEIDVND